MMPALRQRARHACLLLLLGVAGGVHAGEFQPVESIRQAALQTLPAGSDGEATLDPALRLPRCAGTLQARMATAASVEVQCPDARGWRVFVPVRIRRLQQVLVLNRGVAAGESIALDMFAAESRDASRLVGAVVGDAAAATGRVARRSLAAGSVLREADLLSPRLIRRGDVVSVVSRRGGVEVRMEGKAMGDAGSNERITVENLSSRKRVQGVVDAAGEVVVSR